MTVPQLEQNRAPTGNRAPQRWQKTAMMDLLKKPYPY
jgi:hypothetical protein